MVEAAKIHPVLKWAQRKECVFVTIEVEQLDKHEITLKDNVLAFSGTSGDKDYHFSHEMFGEVVEEDSKWNTKGRHIICQISKKDQDASFWTWAIKAGKNAKIQTDYSRWVDSDDEGEEPAQDLEGGQGFGGPGGMGGMGGMPGMGGMGGMGGMEQMMGGMGGMPGMGGEGGMGGMDMAKLQEMMAQMKGGEGMPGMGEMGGVGPDSDDEDEEESNEPLTKADGALDELDGEEENKL
jgi:hypothetical protein